MNPDRFSFNQQRLESLNRETMKRRRAIQQHRMTSSDFLENIPNFRRLPFNHLFRTANSMDIPEVLQSPNDKWFEKNERHFLWQTTLMELQLRSDHDDRTTRVIDALPKQVLTKTTTLALKHVTQ